MTSEASIRLSDLCDLITVQVDPRERPNDVYVGLEHIASGRLVRTGEGRGADVKSAKYAFRAGDILYGKLRPYLDKAVLVEDNGLCTTELLVLRPKIGVDPRFVVGVVHAPAFVKYAVAGTTGVQHPRTSWMHIGDFSLPTLNISEQAKVAELLWRVHEAIYTNEKIIDVGMILKRSVMRVLFTCGLRGEASKETEIGLIPESWDLVSIGDVFEITQGLSLKGNLSTDEQGTPFLRTSNVYWGRMELQTVSRMRLYNVPSSEKELLQGDLLVCEGGEIGRAAVYHGQIDGCLFQNHLHCLRSIDIFRTETHFVMAWLEEAFRYRNSYEGAANRTTIPNLSRSRLADLFIPHPSIEEQREIADILNIIDRKVQLHQRKRTVLEDLFKALLHKLMTGDIRAADLDPSALAIVRERSLEASLVDARVCELKS